MMQEWSDAQSGDAWACLTCFPAGLSTCPSCAGDHALYQAPLIIVQLLGSRYPPRGPAERRAAGRHKLTQYTRYLTVLLCVIQGYFMTMGGGCDVDPGGETVPITPVRIPACIVGHHYADYRDVLPGCGFGRADLERGIGNGISLIIFAGIVARLPIAIYNTGRLVARRAESLRLHPRGAAGVRRASPASCLRGDLSAARSIQYPLDPRPQGLRRPEHDGA